MRYKWSPVRFLFAREICFCIQGNHYFLKYDLMLESCNSDVADKLFCGLCWCLMVKTEKPDNFFSFLLFFPLYVCTCAPRHRRFFVLHVTCLLPTNGRRCLLAAFRRSLIWLVPGQNTGGPSSPNEVEGKHNSSYKLVVSTQSSSHF